MDVNGIMDQAKLHRLCGIAKLADYSKEMNAAPMTWHRVTMKFIGAEYYVLGTKEADIALTTRNGGFGLSFKEPVTFKAEQLLGKKIDQGMLVDVKLVFPRSSGIPELSVASMSQGMYPRVLRSGETVTV